ncbi:MAG: porin [Alphaproteobacteria bacterium]|nr:porin [Alphaproteobacteria bacterium]
MKKLLTSAAVCGLVFAAAPAHADVDLELGGYFKGYGVYVDQDEDSTTPTGPVNDLDFIRNTEIHFTGETTLDNGLIVGFHLEADADVGTSNAGAVNDSFDVDESYAYFAGSWGRVNAGAEDGAAYLLQVAAPSADSNIDGIRQFVNPVNYTTLLSAALVPAGLPIGANNSGGLDYDMDPAGKSDKLTYLSPVMNGFQLGLSYSPDTDNANENGIGLDDQEDTIGATYEAAVRYEGEFNGVGLTAGAGYSHGDNEADAVLPPVPAAVDSDDRQAWNAGLDLDFGAFGVGAAYVEDNGGVEGVGFDDEETWVVGVDYTTGAFKLGASYYDQENSFGIDGVDATRYSGGVTYTYGPGMTFRGSIGYVEHEATGINPDGGNDVDATYVTLGTQINF